MKCPVCLCLVEMTDEELHFEMCNKHKPKNDRIYSSDQCKMIAEQVIDACFQFDNAEARTESLKGLIALELIKAFEIGKNHRLNEILNPKGK